MTCGRPHDLAAEHLADALVAEADAEHRDGGRRSARMTSLLRPASSGRPGPGADQHGVGVELVDLVEGERVVRGARSARRPSSPRYWTRL